MIPMKKKELDRVLAIEDGLVDLLVRAPEMCDANRLLVCVSLLRDIAVAFPSIKKLDPRVACSYLIVIVSIVQNRDISTISAGATIPWNSTSCLPAIWCRYSNRWSRDPVACL